MRIENIFQADYENVSPWRGRKDNAVDGACVQPIHQVTKTIIPVRFQSDIKALSYAGVLCKASVEKQKAIDFIIELIPDLAQAEIKRAVEYAYVHNIFGSNRRRYIKRKRSGFESDS